MWYIGTCQIGAVARVYRAPAGQSAIGVVALPYLNAVFRSLEPIW